MRQRVRERLRGTPLPLKAMMLFAATMLCGLIGVVYLEVADDSAPAEPIASVETAQTDGPGVAAPTLAEDDGDNGGGAAARLLVALGLLTFWGTGVGVSVFRARGARRAAMASRSSA